MSHSKTYASFRYTYANTGLPVFENKAWRCAGSECKFSDTGQLRQPCATCLERKPRSKWSDDGCCFGIVSGGVEVQKGKVTRAELKAASQRLAAMPPDPNEPADEDDDYSRAKNP